MSVNRPLRSIVLGFAMASLILWALAFASLSLDPHEGVPGVLGALAGTCTVLAAMTWFTLALRDRDKDFLLKSMAEDLRRRAGNAPTLPLRRVV